MDDARVCTACGRLRPDGGATANAWIAYTLRVSILGLSAGQTAHTQWTSRELIAVRTVHNALLEDPDETHLVRALQARGRSAHQSGRSSSSSTLALNPTRKGRK